MVAANGLNTLYRALFAVMSIYVVLVPLIFVLRYRYYMRRFDMTVYHKQFQVGWPITGVGIELMGIGGVMVAAWLQQWSPLRQDQWLVLTIVTWTLGSLCMLVGLVLTADGFQYIRTQSRHTPTNHSNH